MRQARPHTRVGARAPLEQPAGNDAQAVHARAQQRDEGRQERRRRGDRDERNQHRPSAHGAHERQWHQQQQRKPDRDGETGEERRAPGGRHRCLQRGGRLLSRCELLAEAEDHEHRVVDRDREADQRDDVGDVLGHVAEVGDDPDEPERGRQRRKGESDGDDHRAQCPEHEQQHRERDRNGDRLAFAEVAVVDRLQVVAERGKASQIDARTRHRADRPAHAFGVVFRVGRLQGRRDLDVG